MSDEVKTFRVLGALLSYPEADLVDALPALRRALDAEGLIAAKERAAVHALLDELGSGELMTVQERYVDLFDRSRSLSLHLFEHVHGESRDRGQAMVDLQNLYAAHGFHLEGSELPDFLPAVLEYLSYRPLEEGRELLADTAHILQALGTRLAERSSAYSAVLAALVSLAGEKPAFEPASGTLREEPDGADLDETWAEPPAFGGCGSGKAPQVAPIRFHTKTARK